MAVRRFWVIAVGKRAEMDQVLHRLQQAGHPGCSRGDQADLQQEGGGEGEGKTHEGDQLGPISLFLHACWKAGARVAPGWIIEVPGAPPFPLTEAAYERIRPWAYGVARRARQIRIAANLLKKPPPDGLDRALTGAYLAKAPEDVKVVLRRVWMKGVWTLHHHAKADPT
eukprot:6991560-Alexandrium_andersonii.AAC.1